MSGLRNPGQLAASWRAGTLRREELEALIAPLFDLADKSLRRGRLDVASDYLELLMLAVPTSAEAMRMRADLAEREGKREKAEGLRELASCLQ